MNNIPENPQPVQETQQEQAQITPIPTIQRP